MSDANAQVITFTPGMHTLSAMRDGLVVAAG
jgi:hypothetical protein